MSNEAKQPTRPTDPDDMSLRYYVETVTQTVFVVLAVSIAVSLAYAFALTGATPPEPIDAVLAWTTVATILATLAAGGVVAYGRRRGGED